MDTTESNDMVESTPEVAVDPDIVSQFREITGCNANLTNSILAKFDQNLEAAIEYFYGPVEDAPNEGVPLEQVKENDPVEKVEDDAPVEDRTICNSERKMPTVEELEGLEISLVSWNIDGLDSANRSSRMEACYYILKRTNPDFIFLQEVVKESSDKCIKKLEQMYNVFFSDRCAVYCTAIFVCKQLEVVSHDVVWFRNSGMGRALQILKGKLGPLTIYLLNTHLESTLEFSNERKSQFVKCMKVIEQLIQDDPDCLLYFGGDLNLRDKEYLEMSSSVPKGLIDAFIAAGSPDKEKYTFDMVKNDNKILGKARCRFDRLFFYGPLHVSSFHLTGKQRIKRTLSFPSDHFAISCVFSA